MVAATLAGSLVVKGGSASAAAVAAPAVAPTPRGVVRPDVPAVDATAAASRWKLPTVTFPAAGSVTVPVSRTAVSAVGAVGVADPAALGSLGMPALPGGHAAQPAGVTAPPAAPAWHPDTAAAVPAAVQVTVLDAAARQELGGAPMAFTVTRADRGARRGPVVVSVDYAGFRDAFGGNYAERLELVRYPACVLTSPAAAGCSIGLPVANQVNDPSRTTLTAIVDADGAQTAASSGSLLAMTSSPSGPSGTYIASPLVPAAHWSVGLQSGSLGYSYPITTPTPPGGPAPSIALDYDSGSVDGRTSVTNPQASWVGMGWDYEPGFIEREYDACNRHGHSNADLCYVSAPINVTISLDGMTTHIIQDADGTWRLQDDPGWTVVDGTGAGNGDATGEYWKLQSPDGTIYYFGRGVGVAGTAATNSAWTVPVFGYPGSTCSPGGVYTSCTKAWRWNLDYVDRTNNNETTYSYAQETNAYNVNNLAPAKSYVRGGHVSSITYGLRDGDTGTPVDRVIFTAAMRCTAKMNGGTGACPALGPANASSYPDVPTDLVCVSGSTSCPQASPSFFTTSMLTNITTSVLSSGTTYASLDSYDLQQQLPDPDGSGPEAPALWLSRVQHTGVAGGSVALPPMLLYGSAMPNRFDVTTGVSPVDMYRVIQIENETGGYLDVNYDTPDPCTTTLENGDHSKNTLDCFPVHWAPQGSSSWVAGWFNKYLITRTGQYVPYLGESPHSTSRTVTSEPIVTDYGYIGGAAWHKNTFEVNPTLSDSWSVYRGYQTVRVNEDQVAGTVIGSSWESVTVHSFYRGMYGDLNNDGTTKTNTVSTAEWGPANDYEFLAGREAEALTETAGSTVLSTTDTDYWASQTARTTTTNPAEAAEEVRPYITMIRVPKSDGSIRRHEIVDVHYAASDPRDIANGAVVTHVDAGDIAGSDPEANCTNTVFVANRSRYLMEPETTSTYAGTASGASCPTSAPLLAHKEFFWDQTADAATAPTNGNLEKTHTELSTAPTWADTLATYDIYGRVLSATDANQQRTTTAYSPSSGRPTSVTVTSPVVHPLGVSLTGTTALDLRGNPTQVTDPNGNVSKRSYDALGRLTAAYAPTESAGTVPTFTATYTASNSTWSTVETKNLLLVNTVNNTGIYHDSVTYLDGWLRTREVHTGAYGGGHLTVQTRFGDTGEVAATSSPYYGNTGPAYGADYTAPASVPLEVDTGYDAMHRVTSQARTVSGAQHWGRTITSYAADQVVSTPPSPAPVTTAQVDIWGRPLVSTAASQLSGDTTTSATHYGYDPLGRLTSVSDDAGKVNTYGYDLAGRRISSGDADAGASTTGYDGNGNVVTTTDARGSTVSTTYDELNRPTAISSSGYTTAPTFPAGTLVSYGYDSAGGGKGLLATTTVHDLGGGSGDWTASIGAYDQDGRAVSTAYATPAVSGQSAGGSYTFNAAYNPDGQPASLGFPTAGGLASDTVNFSYETSAGATGLPTALSSTSGVQATDAYSSLDQLTGRTLGASGIGQTVRTYAYTDSLRRLSEITTTATSSGGTSTAQDDAYSYDNADNPIEVNDRITAAPDANQQTCFTYDGLDRLASAWTETGTCTGYTPTTADGPAGFNSQYAYARNGVPTLVTSLGTVTADIAGDTAHPHAITGFGAGSYSYDADGQQATRTSGGSTTTLSWDPLHHLDQSVSSAGTTGYVSAADGGRLARRDADGSTAIWLPGTELHVAAGTVTATRYYAFAGATIAMRTSTGLTWLASDTQDSRQLAVDASSGAVTRTYYSPYGAVRAGASTLPTDQNFLGRVLDSSGLLQDGARYYDPTVGQFLSTDPLANPSNNQALDPYAYSADNPAAESDPTGLAPTCDGHVNCVTPWAQAKSAGEQSGKVTPEAAKAQAATAAAQDANNALARGLWMDSGDSQVAYFMLHEPYLAELVGGAHLKGGQIERAELDAQLAKFLDAELNIFTGILAFMTKVTEIALAIATIPVGGAALGDAAGAVRAAVAARRLESAGEGAADLGRVAETAAGTGEATSAPVALSASSSKESQLAQLLDPGATSLAQVGESVTHIVDPQLQVELDPTVHAAGLVALLIGAVFVRSCSGG